jgi:hypothetical protein
MITCFYQFIPILKANVCKDPLVVSLRQAQARVLRLQIPVEGLVLSPVEAGRSFDTRASRALRTSGQRIEPCGSLKLTVMTLLLVLGLQSLPMAMAADGSEFVLSAPTADSKKRSRNELKEEIGQKIKQASQAATQMLQQLGKLQQDWGKQSVAALKSPSSLQQRLQESGALHTACGSMCLEVAALQRTYTAAVEKLIENQKPFKKAGRGDLTKTLAILTSMQQQLQSSARAISCLQTSVATVGGDRVAVVAKRLEQEQTKVHALVVSGQQDGCLKTA